MKNAFREAYRYIMQHPAKMMMMMLFDALFVITLLSTNYMLSSFVLNWQSLIALLQSDPIVFLLLLPVLIMYLAVMIFIYTFFKYCILGQLGSQQHEFTLKQLPGLFILDLSISGIFLALFIMLNIAWYYVDKQYTYLFAIAVMVPYILLLYTAVNTSHALFLEEKSVKRNIAKTGSIMLKTPMAISIISAIIMLLLYLPYNALGSMGNKLTNIYGMVMLAAWYSLLMFNRVLFAKIIRIRGEKT